MTRGGRGDRGSASMLVVVHLSVLLVLTCALAAVGGLVTAHRRAQSAADLAALAGAAALADGRDACGQARAIASSNGAQLRDCWVRDREVRVRVTAPGPRWLGRRPSLAAEARAGPA